MKMSDYVRKWDNDNRVWVYEHRQVMERFLGRRLSDNEQIHHVDGNPKNNSIENLEIVDAATHCRIHKPSLKNRICSVEGCNAVHHSRGYCKKHYARFFRKEQGW